MSEHVLHIGRTKVVIAAVFGLHTMGVGELGRAPERVATFDSAVAASRFVEAFKRGLIEEGIDYAEWRPKDVADAHQAALDAAARAEAVPPLIA
jgi:hypothetical protein